VLLGIAGGFRLHFQWFGFLTVGALLLVALLERRFRWNDAVRLVVGLVVGLVPAGYLFLRVHGTWSSPIAGTFVGQVLFGADEYDMLRTYGRHPMREVVASHLGELLRLVARRVAETPRAFWPLLLPTALLALPRARRAGFGPLALAALAVAYYLAFVALAWGLTWRLLMPFSAILAICAAVAVARTFSPRVAVALLAGLVLARAVEGLPAARTELARRVAYHDRSAAVTAALRRHGPAKPQEVFVVDWNLWPTDDPAMVSFYNFGFWNLLHPGFRAERPNPIDTVGDPARFAAFLASRGVRFVVLPLEHRRFDRLAAAARGESALPGFRRDATVGDDVVFVADPDGGTGSTEGG
jgi:hypothetical protein